MSYLVDTNVLSEIRKGSAANPHVLAWARAVAGADDELYVSALVFGEIRRGVERVRLRGDIAQATTLELWLTSLESLYATSGRILPVDARVADVWGRLQARDPLSPVDGLIAATALVHRLTLVTRNVADIRATGVPFVNPFDPAP